MPVIPLGVQLYSVRNEAAKDLPGVLKRIAEMGYIGVEFAGYHNHSATDLRRMLNDEGLTCCGSHTAITTLLGDELLRTAEFNQILGNPYLICPGLPPEYTHSPDAWEKTADTFNSIADRLAPLGMFTGYHNHHTEFTPFPSGELPWDIFFANTKKEVIMQLDTGNALQGGADVTPFLSRYPGRATTVHLKEFSTTNPAALLGEGDVNFPAIFKLCETLGHTRWYIVEYECDAYPPLECIDQCLRRLRRMGK